MINMISAHIHGVEIIKKLRWESGFLGGFPPWAPTGVKVAWSLKG